jgi:hypothetical protein
MDESSIRLSVLLLLLPSSVLLVRLLVLLALEKEEVYFPIL